MIAPSAVCCAPASGTRLGVPCPRREMIVRRAAVVNVPVAGVVRSVSGASRVATCRVLVAAAASPANGGHHAVSRLSASSLGLAPRQRRTFNEGGSAGRREIAVNAAALDAAEAPEPSAGGVAIREAPKSVWYGRALLIFVAAAYGSLSVAFKFVYSLPGPPSAGVIGAVRGVMAAMCFIPMLLKESKRKKEMGASYDGLNGIAPKQFWLAALELAFWNLTAQGACNVALLFTDATRVSFLTQASIAFTPVLVVLSGDKVPAITWVGCALAIAGVVALGFDGGDAAVAAAAGAGISLNIGDIIALAGALCYSLYIFRISAFGRKGLPGDLTQAWKTVLLAVMYVGWAAADWFKWMKAPALVAAPWAGWANPLAWATLAFTAVVCGFLSDILQARGQESVSPSESQVLLAGEPLFAAVFGAVLLGETLGKMGMIGGAGLVAGAILAGMGDSGGGDEQEKGRSKAE